jgi:hypothetical protein
MHNGQSRQRSRYFKVAEQEEEEEEKEGQEGEEKRKHTMEYFGGGPLKF